MERKASTPMRENRRRYEEKHKEHEKKEIECGEQVLRVNMQKK